MNGLRFIDPGLLDRRAVLEENRGERDAMGGRAVRWAEVADISAHLEPAERRGGERFDRDEEVASFRVTLRHRDGVRRGMAFRFGQRRLVIRTVTDPDERRRYLVCRCEEES